MERIKQALEKARLERQQSGSVSALPAASGTTTPGPVSYTHTRTVEVAKNLMQEKRIVSGFDQGVFTDAYKMLRTQVLQRMTARNWNGLGITSPAPGDGKTLTAINLAISLGAILTPRAGEHFENNVLFKCGRQGKRV